MVISLTSGSTTAHASLTGNYRPYAVDVRVTGAAAAAAKGSALADAEVLQILNVPAGTIILGGGIEVTTADTDGSADILMNMGTGAGVDVFVDGGDPSSTGFLAAGTNGEEGFVNALRVEAADTVDIVLDKTTTFSSNDDWEIRAYVILLDVSGNPAPAAAKDVA